MMNELPLRDIHLPDSVSMWPLAPGWWLLLALALLLPLAIYLIRYWTHYRKYRSNLKKTALLQLKQTRLRCEQTDPAECLREVSSLLRRVALSYDAREKVASLTGDNWIKHLDQLSSIECFSESHRELLSQGVHQPAPVFESHALIHQCEQWIKQLPASPVENRRSTEANS